MITEDISKTSDRTIDKLIQVLERNGRKRGTTETKYARMCRDKPEMAERVKRLVKEHGERRRRTSREKEREYITSLPYDEKLRIAYAIGERKRTAKKNRHDKERGKSRPKQGMHKNMTADMSASITETGKELLERAEKLYGKRPRSVFDLISMPYATKREYSEDDFMHERPAVHDRNNGCITLFTKKCPICGRYDNEWAARGGLCVECFTREANELHRQAIRNGYMMRLDDAMDRIRTMEWHEEPRLTLHIDAMEYLMFSFGDDKRFADQRKKDRRNPFNGDVRT